MSSLANRMRLNLAEFPVKEIQLVKRFHYRTGILEVDQQGLIGLVLEDRRIEEASFAVFIRGRKSA